MLEIHAREGAGADLGERFIACFVQAAGDAALPDDPAFRRALTSYMEWAVADVLATHRRTPWWSRTCPSHAGGGTVPSEPLLRREVSISGSVVCLQGDHPGHHPGRRERCSTCC
jgi:hypothetical protein